MNTKKKAKQAELSRVKILYVTLIVLFSLIPYGCGQRQEPPASDHIQPNTSQDDGADPSVDADDSSDGSSSETDTSKPDSSVSDSNASSDESSESSDPSDDSEDSEQSEDSNDDSSQTDLTIPEEPGVSSPAPSQSDAATDNSQTSSNVRDNTPVVYSPSAPGTTVYTCSVASIDASNASDGYIMVKYTGSSPKVKLLITLEGSNTYQYNLKNGDYEAFPLSSNSGKYTVGVYENIRNSDYTTAMLEVIDVTIRDQFGAYLYPNQYCWFTSSSDIVAKGKELAKNAQNELEVVSNVYNYMIKNITYDYALASSVASGYIPNPDTTLSSKTGICLDYASLMTSLLRTQGIPTRLEVGYAGDAYHAWISTYITDVGWINGMMQFDGKHWTLMDPTFGANSSENALRDFIGDGDNYVTKYYY